MDHEIPTLEVLLKKSLSESPGDFFRKVPFYTQKPSEMKFRRQKKVSERLFLLKSIHLDNEIPSLEVLLKKSPRESPRVSGRLFRKTAIFTLKNLPR